MRPGYTKKLTLVFFTIVALLSSSVIAGAQTKPRMRRSTRRTTTTRVVPVGTSLKVRLENSLSSKDSRVGDSFTAIVEDPNAYDGGTVRGHISSIQKSGKIKGRTSMNLAFDSIELTTGRRGTLHGYVTKVYGNDAGRADNEGGVESGSRTNQTVKRAGIGAAAGAIIGAIAGGGKGAGIGLILGGAGGAGSLAIQGSKELKLDSGTELLVKITQ